MEFLWDELTRGLTNPEHMIRVGFRMVVAVLFGAAIGYERERAGKAAGLRTHILVALGTSVFILACEAYSMSTDGLSRVIQGIVTGLGFLGAGTILKLNEQRAIKGLTTSAGIWMTAAIGVAVGLGMIGVALLGTVIAVIILTALQRFEIKTESKPDSINPD